MADLNQSKHEAQSDLQSDIQRLKSAFYAHDDSDLTEVGLARRAQPLADAFRGRLPLARELADINEHFGVEIAQTVFTLALDEVPAYSSFARQVRAFDLRAMGAVTSAAASQYEVTIVSSSLDIPGLEAGSHVESWRSWARSVGFTTDVIHTDPEASLRENAQLISRYLFSHPHPRRILVTYGPGAAEFRTLLTMRRDEPAEVGSIAYWINVAGAYNGASYARRQNDSFFAKLKLEFSKYLGRASVGVRARRWRQLDPRLPAWRSMSPRPPGLKIVNVVGLPLRSQMPQGLMTSYHVLAESIGPNDGAVGLLEAIATPGLIVPIAGMSHRAEAVRLEPVFKRVLGVIATEVGERRAGRVNESSVGHSADRQGPPFEIEGAP